VKETETQVQDPSNKQQATAREALAFLNEGKCDMYIWA